MYAIAPKNRQEVKSWLADLCRSRTRQYFLVYLGKQPVGHIGLKKIDLESKLAETGGFFIKKSYCDSWIFYQSMEYIIAYAKTLGVSLLASDYSSIEDMTPKTQKIFDSLGFQTDPLAPHYSTLKL
jgi:hypothetical protein